MLGLLDVLRNGGRTVEIEKLPATYKRVSLLKIAGASTMSICNNWRGVVLFGYG